MNKPFKLTSARRKELKQYPDRITAREVRFLLDQAHELQNLRTMNDLNQNKVKQVHTLYEASNQQVNHRNTQITSLGHKLDETRKLVPEEARRALLEPSKPGNGQADGFGAYTVDAPIAERL